MENSFHRNTSQKKEIIGAVLSAKRHLKADEVYSIVKKKIPEISLGTVYRNLKHLSEDGIISSTDHYGISFFEKPGNYHAHFECVKCEEIFDFPSKKPSVPENLGRIISLNLSVRGICKGCGA